MIRLFKHYICIICFVFEWGNLNCQTIVPVSVADKITYIERKAEDTSDPLKGLLLKHINIIKHELKDSLKLCLDKDSLLFNKLFSRAEFYSESYWTKLVTLENGRSMLKLNQYNIVFGVKGDKGCICLYNYHLDHINNEVTIDQKQILNSAEQLESYMEDSSAISSGISIVDLLPFIEHKSLDLF